MQFGNTRLEVLRLTSLIGHMNTTGQIVNTPRCMWLGIDAIMADETNGAAQSRAQYWIDVARERRSLRKVYSIRLASSPRNRQADYTLWQSVVM